MKRTEGCRQCALFFLKKKTMKSEKVEKPRQGTNASGLFFLLLAAVAVVAAVAFCEMGRQRGPVLFSIG